MVSSRPPQRPRLVPPSEKPPPHSAEGTHSPRYSARRDFRPGAPAGSPAPPPAPPRAPHGSAGTPAPPCQPPACPQSCRGFGRPGVRRSRALRRQAWASPGGRGSAFDRRESPGSGSGPRRTWGAGTAVLLGRERSGRRAGMGGVWGRLGVGARSWARPQRPEPPPPSPSLRECFQRSERERAETAARRPPCWVAQGCVGAGSPSPSSRLPRGPRGGGAAFGIEKGLSSQRACWMGAITCRLWWIALGSAG